MGDGDGTEFITAREPSALSAPSIRRQKSSFARRAETRLLLSKFMIDSFLALVPPIGRLLSVYAFLSENVSTARLLERVTRIKFKKFNKNVDKAKKLCYNAVDKNDDEDLGGQKPTESVRLVKARGDDAPQ